MLEVRILGPLSFVLIFAVPPALGVWAAAAWVFLAFIVASTAFALFQVPYIALSAELTDDAEERSTLMAWQTELQSHYNVCNLRQQFDFVIHVDRSTALRVDSAGKRNGKTMKDSSVSSSPWDRMLLDKYGFDIIYKDLLDSPVDTATSE